MAHSPAPDRPDPETESGDLSLDALHRLAEESYAGIPAELRLWTEGVVIRVADWPENDVLDEMGFESPYDLLGLYHGVALTERSSGDIAPPVDMIFLYRQPILAYREDTGFALRDIVRNTLIHEIGHHFGLSDAAMDRLEDEAAAEDTPEDRGDTGGTPARRGAGS